MTYKALFLDIDGTTLKSDHTCTDSTRQAILETKQNGIEVFFATGRPIHEIKKLANKLHIESFIGYNGAYATFQDKMVLNAPMEKQTVSDIVHTAQKLGHDFVLYTYDSNYFSSLDATSTTSFIQLFQLEENKLYQAEILDQVLGMTLINVQEDELDDYKLGKDMHLSQVNIEGAQSCFDVIRDQMNKGQAIKEVMQELGYTAEDAIAFGDGMNDKEMLQTAGASFAMANAHPDLFQYAKYRTSSVDEDGISQGLRKLGVIN
ncbi:HAD family hydrolase [Virgibacillus halophilus]|uniref:HAD family hydrolase n=1 Tax=Tigheibacillus halophilus TaxID=361280 RepID=A0ABU5C312_9BACI|nr:HAD family hydrolase [Virgibacillus halophilus]